MVAVEVAEDEDQDWGEETLLQTKGETKPFRRCPPTLEFVAWLTSEA